MSLRLINEILIVLKQLNIKRLISNESGHGWIGNHLLAKCVSMLYGLLPIQKILAFLNV